MASTILCDWGELANWNSHFQCYICSKCNKRITKDDIRLKSFKSGCENNNLKEVTEKIYKQGYNV